MSTVQETIDRLDLNTIRERANRVQLLDALESLSDKYHNFRETLNDAEAQERLEIRARYRRLDERDRARATAARLEQELAQVNSVDSGHSNTQLTPEGAPAPKTPQTGTQGRTGASQHEGHPA